MALTRRFEAASLAGLDEPVRRYLSHAIAEGAALPSAMRLTMAGRIDVGREGFGPIPFGGRIHAERRFGDLVLPSRVEVGWWLGTPRYRPFFEATILDAEALG